MCCVPFYFIDLELVHVGLTKTEAQQQGYVLRVTEPNASVILKAKTLRQPDGISKTNQKIEVKPMTQLPQAELVSTAPMNAYRWQHRLDRSQSHRSSEKCSRNRGVFLSQKGWQKLIQAGVLHTEYGERRTYEELSAQSLLDKRTVSRLLSCEVKVDKGTLKIFFQAFNLSLEVGDYVSSKDNEVNNVKLDALTHTNSTLQQIEFEQIVEELFQLKQQLREYDRLFQRLGLNESILVND